MTTELKAKHLRLTQNEEAYALFLFQGKSQIDSYHDAYPTSQKWSDNSVYVEASRKANIPKILLRIKELRDMAAAPFVMTELERKARLSEIGRANLVDFVNSEGNIELKPSAALAELVIEDWRSGGRESESRSKRLKLRDPIAAIAELNKMERIGQPDTVVNNNIDNRQIHITVQSEQGRTALESLKSGKLPALQLGEH